MIENIILKIKRKETPLYAFLNKLARFILTIKFPCIKPLHTLLYYERRFRIDFLRRLRTIFYYDPLLRARCEKVGRNFVLIVTKQGMPYIYGNLKIYIGDNVIMHDVLSLTSTRVFKEPKLIIGDHTYIGQSIGISVGKEVRIGNYCYLANGVQIFDNDGHPLDWQKRRLGEPVNAEDIRPVIIEDDVWIGDGVCIMKGTHIHKGAVIAAKSVVRGEIPEYCVAAGNPAQVIKHL
ncbi:MAG: acyltransferase [Candidatus Omnitrophota bacterium]